MNKLAQSLIKSAHTIIDTDSNKNQNNWRFIIHQVIFLVGVLLTFIWSAQERIIAVLAGIITISYIPFIVIELYHRSKLRIYYLYAGVSITVLWLTAGLIDNHLMINTLRAGGITIIAWWVWDYCRVIRTWKTWNIYNQVSTIGVFVVSIVFALLTMRRFQSINFSCSNINFLSAQFFVQVPADDIDKKTTVTNVVASGGRSNYLELLDERLEPSSDTNSLANTIKKQVRNSVVTVMDQKQLYDKSICDYVTKALNDNYRKPGFFYSGVFLLTFIALAASRLALIIIASIFSLIMWILHRMGVYRSTTTMIEHEMLE